MQDKLLPVTIYLVYTWMFTPNLYIQASCCVLEHDINYKHKHYDDKTQVSGGFLQIAKTWANVGVVKTCLLLHFFPPSDIFICPLQVLLSKRRVDGSLHKAVVRWLEWGIMFARTEG